MSKMRHRVLFAAESVSLSQVVRLVTLARGLDPSRYEVHFACSEFDPLVFDGTSFPQWPLESVGKAFAEAKLERGQRIYEEALLRRYVDEELALFQALSPDLVVGDFRLSLAISAPLAGVPCATLINAYWSPHAVRDRFPVPDHPLVSLLGAARAERLFPYAMPAAFAHFAAPVNAVRRRYGLAPIGGLLEVLSYGDLVLFPDVPELCPTRELPPRQHFIGHVPWSPSVGLSPELERLWAGPEPFVYVTLGSTGRVSALPAVLEALGRLPVRALLATAGRPLPCPLPENVSAADYVPGELVARAARLVITNGGASTSYQALAAGKPVLGIPSNLDQYLAMTSIERAGAGRLVRAGGIAADAVVAAADELLASEALAAGARAVARAFARHDCHELFARVLHHALSSGDHHARCS